MNDLQVLLSEEVIINKIFVIRSKKVMLDKDLSELYGVSTKVLKQQVKRNTERFPEDFMFELSNDEFYNLRSQFVTSSWGGTRYLPKVFTEQGVAMLSSVLNSRQAILVNIQIIRIFTKMRELLITHNEILQKLEQLGKKDIEQDKEIALIFKHLKQLEKAKQDNNELTNRPRIGY
jgi:hypothetical protein